MMFVEEISILGYKLSTINAGLGRGAGCIDKFGVRDPDFVRPIRAICSFLSSYALHIHANHKSRPSSSLFQ